MHLHRYTPRKALRMALRPWRRLAWRLRPPRMVEAEAWLDAAPERVSVVVAHPDDEIFCGGLIAALAERGRSVGIACMTRGEGGPAPDGGRQALATIREAELRKSADALGAAGVRFLGYVDPRPRGKTARAPRCRAGELRADLGALFAEEGPGLILTHGSSGEYWHPAHILLHDAVMAARPRGVPVATFNAFRAAAPLPEIVNEDDAAHLVLDVSPHAERRRAALAAHGSQAAVFEHFARACRVDFLAATEVEAYCLR